MARSAARPASSLHPAVRVSPAPGPGGLRMLRLHADASRPKVTGRAEAATAAAIFPQPRPEAEAEAARNLVRRRTGPGEQHLPSRRLGRGSSGVRPGRSDGLHGRGELREQAAGPAGTRERRGGRGAQVRTPVCSAGVAPAFPAQTRGSLRGGGGVAGGGWARRDRLQEGLALRTPRVRTETRPPSEVEASSAPRAARSGFGRSGTPFFSRPEVPPPPPAGPPAWSQPSPSVAGSVHVCTAEVWGGRASLPVGRGRAGPLGSELERSEDGQSASPALTLKPPATSTTCVTGVLILCLRRLGQRG